MRSLRSDDLRCLFGFARQSQIVKPIQERFSRTRASILDTFDNLLCRCGPWLSQPEKVHQKLNASEREAVATCIRILRGNYYCAELGRCAGLGCRSTPTVRTPAHRGRPRLCSKGRSAGSGSRNSIPPRRPERPCSRRRHRCCFNPHRCPDGGG